jgi:hypothetical protein
MENLIDIIHQIRKGSPLENDVVRVKASDLKTYATHSGIWNDEDEQKELRASLKDLGWEDTDPAILTVTQTEAFLSDGNHRLAMVIQLFGLEATVPVSFELK